MVTASAPGAALGDFSVDVHFDATLVVVTNCVAAPQAQAVCNPALAPGAVRLAGNFTPGLTGSITLGTITFAAGPNGGFTSLSLSVDVLADPEGHDIPVSVTNGSITITTAPPSPTNTPATTGTPVPPTNTPVPPTSTAVPSTATRPLPTETPVAGPSATDTPTNTPPGLPHTGPGEPTDTPAPPATPTAAEAATPEKTPVKDFILEISWPPSHIPAGNKVVLGVDLHMPELSVTANLGIAGNVAQVKGPEGIAFPIYFEGSSATVLTLHVDPGKNFSVDYSPDQEQEMRADTQEIRWDVGLTPERQASGKQKVTLTLTQRLASNHPIPGTIRPQHFYHDITVEGPGKSHFGDVMNVLRWALPAGGLPSLAIAIGFIVAKRQRIREFLRESFGGRRGGRRRPPKTKD